jgi:hypothetical protein
MRSMVEGACRASALECWTWVIPETGPIRPRTPSTALRAVPLPQRGRIKGGPFSPSFPRR